MAGKKRKKRGARSGTSFRGVAAAAFGAVCAVYAGVLGAKWANVPVIERGDFIPLGMFFAGFAALGVLFAVMRFRPDPRLFFPVVFLCGVGVAVQFRFQMYHAADLSSIALYAYPLGVAACGVAVLVLRAETGRRLLAASAPVCYLGALALLGVMAVLGHRFRGGFFLEGGINPTEAVKILLVIAVARWLSGREKEWARTRFGMPYPSLGVLLPLLFWWSIPMLMLVYLRDLGMLMLCNGCLFLMLYAATSRAGYLGLGLALACAVAGGGYFLTPHVATRISAWLFPFRDPTGTGWQTLQALSAMYSGGTLGIGLGAGLPRLIPVASTDFVYAVIGEELGFIGCVLVVAAFLALFKGAFDAATAQKEPFMRHLTTGLAALLCLQTLLNVGGVIKALPLTGVPLPFVSRGGSSLAVSFFALGVLLAAAAVQKPAKRRK